MIKLARLVEVLRNLKNKKTAILTHRHADVDAIASAYLIKYLITKLGGEAEILIYEGLNRDAENLAKYYNIRYKRINGRNGLNNYEEIVVVDTQSVEQIEILEGMKVYAVIDHHERSATLIESNFYFINKEAVSNTQNILWNTGMNEFGEKEKELIAISFISDTFRFKRFDKKAARDFYLLLEEVKKDYEELLKLAFTKKTKEEKKIILNAIKSSEYEEVDDYLIAYTITEESTGEIASLLTNFSDISLVFKPRDDGRTGLSIRCNDFFPFELNKIAEKVAKEIGGAGGGHKKAAGALLSKSVEECKKAAVRVVKDFIRNK